MPSISNLLKSIQDIMRKDATYRPIAEIAEALDREFVARDRDRSSILTKSGVRNIFMP